MVAANGRWQMWGEGGAGGIRREAPRGWAPQGRALSGLTGDQVALVEAAARYRRRCELGYAADASLRAGADALLDMTEALGGDEGDCARGGACGGVALVVAGALLAYLDLAEWGGDEAHAALVRREAQCLLDHDFTGPLAEWALATDGRLDRLVCATRARRDAVRTAA